MSDAAYVLLFITAYATCAITLLALGFETLGYFLMALPSACSLVLVMCAWLLED